MMKFFKNITGRLTGKKAVATEKDDFADFFLNAKSAEKTKILRQVMREAIAEQKAVMEKYNNRAKV